MSNEKETQYDACIELQRNGQTEEAIASLLQLTQSHADYALPYLALSTFYSKLDRFEDALRYGKEYCRLEPEDPFGYTALSSLSIKAGLREEAEKALVQAQDARIAAALKK